MIDYVKVSLNSVMYSLYLLSHPLLRNTKELKTLATGHTLIIGTYRGLTFKIYESGYVQIDGSLHKYLNNGQHNYNDFGPADLNWVVQDLQASFGEELLSARIQNLEYGLNVHTPFDPTDFTNSIITYSKSGMGEQGRQKNPITKDDRKGFDKGIRFILGQYNLKIYNKGKQYKQVPHILRVEFKTVKMEVIRDSQIKVLEDLLDINKIEMLHHKLLQCFRLLVVKELVNQVELSRNEQRIWQECINPDNWIHAWNKEKRKTRRHQFNHMLQKYALSDMKQIVQDLLQAKYVELNSVRSTPLLTSVSY